MIKNDHQRNELHTICTRIHFQMLRDLTNLTAENGNYIQVKKRLASQDSTQEYNKISYIYSVS